MLDGRSATFQCDVIDCYILIAGSIEFSLVEEDPSTRVEGSTEEDRTQCSDEIRKTL